MTHFAPRSFASTLVGWSAVLAILAALQLTGCTDDGWVVDPAQTLPDDDVVDDDDDVTPAPADDDDAAGDDDDAAGDDDSVDDDDTVEPPVDDDDVTDTQPVDADGDGHTDAIDCDDADANVHIGAAEVCDDGIDQDCDGSDAECDTPPADDDDAVSDDDDDTVEPPADDDDATPPPDPVVDADGDGYAATNAAGNVIDCADLDANVHPGATEICGNSVDEDCSGSAAVCPPVDADGDGHTDAIDCNDLDASVHPGAAEVCDGIDQDCDSVIDEGFDADGDTWTVCEADCNDLDATVHPFAADLCGDGIDSDCDNLASDETPFSGFIDFDGDGWGSTPFAGCAVPSTGVSAGGDCNDLDPLIYPGASEQTPGIDGIDNDCDGVVDEVFEAFVGVTYAASWAYQLNVQFFWAGSVIGDWWDITVSVPGAPTVSYTFLASTWDIEGACGLRFNVTEGAPASGWYCQGDALNGAPEVEIWWRGVWYDEDDLVVWSVPNSPGGDCSALLLLSTTAICQP